jgi:hypothetical protein
MLVGDSAKCPLCSFEWILEGNSGECPGGCGNKWDLTEFDNYKMISWDQDSPGYNRVEKCKKCDERVVEYISETDKFIITKIECEKCKISNSNFVRKDKGV